MPDTFSEKSPRLNLNKKCETVCDVHAIRGPT